MLQILCKTPAAIFKIQIPANTKSKFNIGDTFPGGCAFDESIVHHKYLKENPDDHNPAYNTKYGVYSEGCGLENVMMSWGHDDYMYLVAKEKKTTLPAAGLSVIKYHSLLWLVQKNQRNFLNPIQHQGFILLLSRGNEEISLNIYPIIHKNGDFLMNRS
uniref:Inositol oxygenase n=1 Tax=Vitis vinifera TaxID=29760 RepID=F6HY66_VITVI